MTSKNNGMGTQGICKAGSFLESAERQLRALKGSLAETKLNGDADSNRVTIEALSIQAEQLEGTCWQAKEEIEAVRRAIIKKETLNTSKGMVV